MVAFTIVDHGEAGLDFGLATCGVVGQPEAGQTAEHGAVTLEVGAETTVDCNLQLRASVDAQSAGGAVLPTDAFSWSIGPDALTATPLTSEYVTVGSSGAGSSEAIDIWHWLSVPPGQPPAAYSGAFCYRAVPDAP